MVHLGEEVLKKGYIKDCSILVGLSGSYLAEKAPLEGDGSEHHRKAHGAHSKALQERHKIAKAEEEHNYDASAEHEGVCEPLGSQKLLLAGRAEKNDT